MDTAADPVLGAGVFRSAGEPPVEVFEQGFTYAGDRPLKVRYDDIVGLDLLDLRGLMKATRVPDEPVEFGVTTAEGSHRLRVHLFLYTTLSAFLNTLHRES